MNHTPDHRASTQVGVVGFIAVIAFLFAALLAVPPAFAHPGHEYARSFTSGFMHPLVGIDHMLAMLSVGVWAGTTGGRAVWAWPLAFVTLMLGGATLGIAQLAVPLVEPGILASLMVLGLALAIGVTLSPPIGAALVGLFALLHGYAHGVELATGAPVLTYVIGFTLATATLHGVGLIGGIALAGGRLRWASRVIGTLVAATGVVLAFN